MVNDADSITVGLADIYINSTISTEYGDGTGWSNVGSVRDGTLEMVNEVLEHKSGTPQIVDKRYIIERGGRFTATWEEVRAPTSRTLSSLPNSNR